LNRRELTLTVLALKEVQRAGWARAGHKNGESVADHSWSVAMLALIHCPPDLNREKVLTMAVLHDLAELRVGDITPHDGVAPARKHALEDAAMAELLAEHPDLLAIWREGELRVSPEAQFLKQLDRLDLGLQATRYQEQGYISEAAEAEFRASAGPLLIDAPTPEAP